MSLSNGQEAGITRHKNRANLEFWISIASSFCRIGKSKSNLCVFMRLDYKNLRWFDKSIICADSQ